MPRNLLRAGPAAQAGLPRIWWTGRMQHDFLVESPLVASFVAEVRELVAAAVSPAEACSLIRPRFAELLAADGWLPEQFQEPAAESGMGGGIGQWLLYRARDGSL